MDEINAMRPIAVAPPRKVGIMSQHDGMIAMNGSQSMAGAVVEQVLEVLRYRSQAKASISLLGSDAINSRIPLYHGNIEFTDVHYGHLQELLRMDKEPWIQLVHRAMLYGCHITIRLGVALCPLLPIQILYSWPFVFRDCQGRRLYGFHQKNIVASMVRTCESKAVLVLHPHQQVTLEARDVLDKLRIDTIISVS